MLNHSQDRMNRMIRLGDESYGLGARPYLQSKSNMESHHSLNNVFLFPFMF